MKPALDGKRNLVDTRLDLTAFGVRMGMEIVVKGLILSGCHQGLLGFEVKPFNCRSLLGNQFIDFGCR